MAGPEEDDDETLIADTGMADESTDEGRTLVVALPQDDQDETLIARFPVQLAPRGPLPAPGALPRMLSRPTPAAGRPVAAPPAAGTAGTKRGAAPVAVDLDRRALPFAVTPRGGQPKAAQPKGDFFPVTHTQELPSVAQVRAPATRPASGSPAPAARARQSTPAPAPGARGLPSSPAPAARPTPTPPPPAPRAGPIAPDPTARTSNPTAPLPTPMLPAPPALPAPAAESVMVAPATGTPPFVIRFLLVCGVLTALGLLMLIYLEL